MKDRSEIIADFQKSRAKLIAQGNEPSTFLFGWVQALAYVLGEDCP